MAEETAVAEAPVAVAPAQTAPVNPNLAKLLAREFSSAPRDDRGQPAEPAPEPAAEPKPDAKPAAEKPTIVHADLPPAELLSDEGLVASDEKDEIPLPEEPPDSIKTEKGKADWKAWRQNWKETQTEIRQLREQVAKGGAPTEELTNLKAQNAQLLERLQQMSPVIERVSLQDHPAFQAQFIKPREQMVAEAKSVLEMAEISPDVFERAINLTGKAKAAAVDELMEGVSSRYVQTQIGELIYKIEALDKQKAEVLADIPANHQRMELERRAEQHRQMEQQAKQNNALLDQTFDFLRDKQGIELLRDVPGNDKWNETRKAKREEARYLLQSANPQEAMAAAVLATLAPEYRQWALGERKRANALEKELAELRGADPKLGARTSADSAAEDLSGPAAILAKEWKVPGK